MKNIKKVFILGASSDIGLSIMKIYKKNNYSILAHYNKGNKKFFHFVKLNKINTPMGNGNVLNTNNCEISVCKTRYKNRIVIFSAIDNLVKGASGQAIQNMNLMYNFNESLGLR